MQAVTPRVALVGAGRWGANHLRVLRTIGASPIVVDADETVLRRLADAGVPRADLTKSLDDVLDRIDCAIVATPATAHAAVCARLLKAGKDVLCEKPMGTTAAEALSLARLAAAEGRLLQAGYILRFDPAAVWMRDAVAEGAFGRLRMLRGHFGGFKRPRADTGVTLADGVHFLDLFNFVLGVPPAHASARTARFLGRAHDDQSHLWLDYAQPGGAPVLASVESGYHLPGKHREVVVVGDRMTAVCDFNVAQYKIRIHENRHEVTPSGIQIVEGPARQLEFPPVELLLVEVRAFLDSVRTRQPAGATAMDAYRCLRAVEAALGGEGVGVPIRYAAGVADAPPRRKARA